MKIAGKMFQRNDRGYALLITIVFAGIALLLLGSVMNWSNSTSKQAERNNLFSMSTAAAEAATERAMAQMWRDYYNQSFNSTSNYTGDLPNQAGWPVQFSFDNGSGVANRTGVSTSPTDWTKNWVTLHAFNSQYAGLSAYVAQCTVTSTATTSNQLYPVSATVLQQFQLAAIPIFQYAVFYNLNMEIDPGATMTLTGPVFSNGSIWARGLGTFNSSVSAVGVVNIGSTDPYLLTKNDANQSTFNQGWTSNADTMSMPIGTTNDPNAIRSLLNLPPPGTDPYSVNGQDYFMDQATLIISNSSSGAISTYFQDPNSITPITLVPYDMTNQTYSFVTNVNFYDYREGKTVQAVQLNVGALKTWLNSTNATTYNTQLTGDTGHGVNSVYVYNNRISSSTSLPAVRVANGTILPTNGLTVVTPDPLYVLGNYNASGSSLNNGTNVANTVPAALIADAITVLSPDWQDSYNSSTLLSSRSPTATTVNAAAFEGIVPSSGNNYSGGVENFLRLLENWSGVTLTYNGSIVVMFPSQYATHNWQQTGIYYNAPRRNWAFDVNFMTQNGLPPLTPEVRALIRQGWSVR